jgi:hypothetical protein
MITPIVTSEKPIVIVRFSVDHKFPGSQCISLPGNNDSRWQTQNIVLQSE